MNTLWIEEREEFDKCCESSLFRALAIAAVGGGPRDYVSGPVDCCLSAQTPYQGCL